MGMTRPPSTLAFKGPVSAFTGAVSLADADRDVGSSNVDGKGGVAGVFRSVAFSVAFSSATVPVKSGMMAAGTDMGDEAASPMKW
jgi:hypothetical protein